MRKIFYVVIVVSLLSCEIKKHNLTTYIISKEDTELAGRICKKNIPPPVPVLYSFCNIILAENNTAYIHRLYVRRRCLSYEQSKPDFLGLMPADFVILSGNQLIPYLENNVFDAICTKGITVSIASQKDTIVHPSFSVLRDYLKKQGLLLIRRTTEEEDMVLKAKKGLLIYNPENIKWINGFHNMSEIKTVWAVRSNSFKINYRP